MTSAAERFFNSIEDGTELSQKELVSLFVYFVTVEMGHAAATVASVNEAFASCDLLPPARTAAYLSEGTKSRPPLFLKSEGGYKLHRSHREELAGRLGTDRVVAQTSSVLRQLEGRVASDPERSFLSETIDCFEIGANRAAILMCWLLTIDHLHNHVLSNHLMIFNAELAKNKDKRVRCQAVTSIDDFSDIPEGKFIELLRAAKIISNDVRKILDAKLGIRNSSAHPSSVAIKRSKVVDFIEDLTENVLLKYPA